LLLAQKPTSQVVTPKPNFFSGLSFKIGLPLGQVGYLFLDALAYLRKTGNGNTYVCPRSLKLF
jgi:hypothetical protein